MKKVKQLIARGLHLFANDSLFRNSVYLIASTAIMSVLGFGFWLFVAHLYTPEQVGSASALIAVATLLGNISLLGFDAALVRFLPSSKNQTRDINTGILSVAAVAVVSAAAYIFIGPLLGVAVPLIDAEWEKTAFILLIVVVTVNSLTDAVFIANRRAGLHTTTYSVLALVKLLLPLVLVQFGGMGIFAAFAFAMLSSLVLSFYLMRRFIAYHSKTKPNWHILKKTRKYTAHNYAGRILSSVTAQIMPVFILTHLGADRVAYFAMAWTMANFFYIIPAAIAQSLLAEGSTTPADKKHHIKHASRLIAMVIVPIVIIAIATAPYILHIFGAQYSAGSTAIFQILAFATLFIAFNEVSNTILNIEHRSSGVVASQLCTLVVTLVSALVLLPMGLVGMGLALLFGNIAASICHAIVFLFGLGKGQGLPADEEYVQATTTS